MLGYARMQQIDKQSTNVPSMYLPFVCVLFLLYLTPESLPRSSCCLPSFEPQTFSDEHVGGGGGVGGDTVSLESTVPIPLEITGDFLSPKQASYDVTASFDPFSPFGGDGDDDGGAFGEHPEQQQSSFDSSATSSTATTDTTTITTTGTVPGTTGYDQLIDFASLPTVEDDGGDDARAVVANDSNFNPLVAGGSDTEHHHHSFDYRNLSNNHNNNNNSINLFDITSSFDDAVNAPALTILTIITMQPLPLPRTRG